MATGEDVRRAVRERVRGGLIPTPNAMDWVSGTAKPMRDADGYLKYWLAKLKGGTAYPSPAFLEEMMGFPIGYTIEPFLDKSK